MSLQVPFRHSIILSAIALTLFALFVGGCDDENPVQSSPPADPSLRVPSQYPTIQAAVDAARDGDVVAVEPGTYSEKVVLPNRELTLRSLSGDPGDTILEGSFLIDGADVLVSLTGDSAGTRTITGFTFKDCRGPAVSVDWTQHTGTVVVENCRFVNGGPYSPLRSSGVYMEVLNNEFIGNRSYLFGGALQIQGSARVVGNVFRNNDAIIYDTLNLTQGGAIMLVNVGGREGSTVEIRDNYFENNTCTDYGAAVHIGGNHNVTVAENHFVGNTAGACAGGVYVIGNSGRNVVIENNLFEHNSAPRGASIGVDISTGPVVRNNTIIDSVGEGIRVEGSNNVTVTGNLVYSGLIGIVWTGSSGMQSCNNAWENPQGNYAGGPSTTTNYTENPGFCDAAGGDYGLAANSFCLPANNGCGVQIGAFGASCDSLVAVSTE